MASTLPILIAGGGIGGLAAASLLAQDGHQVTVLEQSAAFGEIGAGIQLGPNIFKMFEYLGLTDAVNQVAYFPPGDWHAAGVQRELRNQMFQSGTESADSAGLKWMYTGIDPKRQFA